MQRRSRFALLAALCLTVLITTFTACSKSTAPAGGGGVAKELDSPNLGTGSVYPHKFTAAGTYNYDCRFHGVAMSGSVTVVNGNPTTSASVTVSDNFYNPSSVTVGPNATVTWTSNGSNTHSVTSK